ncbi:MAG: UDP-3-O-acyl-N-acetylglucosamine deacetylase [Hyphomonas sp.]|uniref:UDP-3-O-acyl-N-acetylglucosamine deacetylase n=1 Tax=Hyphomonas sp. TaxID=87 RepID=UPI0017D78649|nr:UDP-3-O-acyl-N-acetylglucosamine deacetylase [Hyphomonas sp.]MBA3068426.1 UDP-3-O-acyl-N-acetylglucosamine deacetylase [Hyphomonas sp.]MBU3919593.1 UDP-3-O-acyl-N-acetylglucosamine deacetylase [Alphaproteobacteria bacterium]MBU4060706.1 UDP-3-O-acyl-N-acetylglucosamine deacetylase [Alphaproteobacteria bacterium]MBU4164690.1 UDP-3-O-acyl-N-acetylglucosamine deacetylase [Alphaproteobacteria bacterium]
MAVERQTTIARKVSCAGIGVHSGARARLTMLPAVVNSGIRFVRVDVPEGTGEILAHAESVSDTQLGTTLSNEEGVSVAVVEHLLAAIAGLGIDNLVIEIDGPEVPIMDGSSSVFYELMMMAGLKAQGAARRRIRILETIEVRDGPKHAVLSPSDHDVLTLRARIEYDDAHIGVQQMAMRLAPGMFARDLAFARTYGFARDVEMLRSMGLARGGSLDNAVVIGENGVMNPEGLRSEDEFVRHKMLDAVGDLMLAGAPIAGNYDAVQPGHGLNNRLVRALLATPSAWCWEEAGAPAVLDEVRAAV